MTHRGHVRNGVVVLDEPAALPEGATVEIVEVATRDDLFLRPAHPYTKALIAAALAEEACAEQTAAQLEGEPSSPIDPPAGCRFHPRCPIGRDRDLCHTLSPADSPVGDEHLVRCHFWPEATST